MKILPRFSRRLVLLLIAAGALAALVVEVGAAGASPATSPTFEPLVPSDGGAVQASGEPLKVTFSCPSFVYEEGEVIEEEVEEPEEEPEEGEEGEEEGEGGEEEVILPVEPVIGPPTLGTPENYAVHFSTSSAVNAGGQLGTAGFGEAGEGEAEGIKPANTTCASELELPTKPYPATLYEGRIYWQAYRESTLVPDEIEVGPVHSFVVYPYIEEPEVTFREQVFQGYLTKVGFAYEAELGGSTVELQEWDGSAWTKIAEAPGSNSGENAFYAKFKNPGRHIFRPVVTSGSMAGPLILERITKVVRKPTKARVTSAADDGAYVAANGKEREEWPITFSVSKNGGTLSSLSVEAETTCKGPTKAQDVKLEVPALLKHARIAPDGTVFGVTTTPGPEVWTVTLVGSLFQGRFQGELLTSHANCIGYRTIDAILKKSVQAPTK
ncbi:MAG TPA: hypothetical protein VHZ54_18885 [Solirubrobacterales bacterium]|jgi:hypothetical protein|nr:hypothetical protein [Solirubrobacterales bacterium]